MGKTPEGNVQPWTVGLVTDGKGRIEPNKRLHRRPYNLKVVDALTKIIPKVRRHPHIRNIELIRPPQPPAELHVLTTAKPGELGHNVWVTGRYTDEAGTVHPDTERFLAASLDEALPDRDS